RDVPDADFVGQRGAKSLLKQLVDAGEEGRERLARSRRRRDERVAARLNLAPAALLRRRRRAERVRKPACDDGMKGRNTHESTRVDSGQRRVATRPGRDRHLGGYMESAPCP